MHGPDPDKKHALPGFEQTIFLKNVITRPNIEVGDYTYFDDPNGPDDFENNNVLYQFDFLGDRLIIGKFVAIARDVQFIMNGANHLMDGFSTYPFNIFQQGWENGFNGDRYFDASRGDTRVGNDVWIGRGARILPGVTIGNGAVIGTEAVVARDVAPYTIVAGNPAKVLRERFAPEIVERLQRLAWWDWSADKITRNLDAIRGQDLEKLSAAK